LPLAALLVDLLALVWRAIDSDRGGARRVGRSNRAAEPDGDAAPLLPVSEPAGPAEPTLQEACEHTPPH